MTRAKPARRSKSDLAQIANTPLEVVAEHHLAVREMMSDRFVDLPEAETLDIRLAVHAILAGQQSLLANQAEQAAEIAKIRAKFAVYDRSARAWENDRAKFMDEVIQQGQKLKATGDRAERIKARGVKQYEQAVQHARATVATDRLALDQKLAAMPQVTVTAPGELEIRSQRGNPQPVIVPTLITIGHRRWVLPPGQAVTVPLAVAQQLEQRARSQAETNARKALLSGDIKDNSIHSGMERISQQYGSSADPFPIASQV